MARVKKNEQYYGKISHPFSYPVLVVIFAFDFPFQFFTLNSITPTKIKTNERYKD